jgi:hypothetical protein
MNRRQVLRAGAALVGGMVGQRVLGPFLPRAEAALETSHLVFVYYHGGFNGVFGGAGAAFRNKAFGVTDGNLKAVGDGVFTDAATFGTMPQFALDHWAAVGFVHNDPLHTQPTNPNSGSERSITRKGNTSYFTTLAKAMGGGSPIKAAHTGAYPSFRVAPAAGDVSLQNIQDFNDVLKAAGALAPDTSGPSRDAQALGLNTAGTMSKFRLDANPESLKSLGEAFPAGVAALQQPPPAPVDRDEVMKAYGVGNSQVKSFAGQLAAAEVAIRATGSNVVTVFDGFFGEWDFDSGVSMQRSRSKYLGTGGFSGNRVAPLNTFCQRMLNVPGRNVVVACLGDFVRLTTGHGHGEGAVAAIFGKYIKRGLYNGCDEKARFAPSTPKVEQFWAGLAAALRVPGTPFGANPYTYSA